MTNKEKSQFRFVGSSSSSSLWKRYYGSFIDHVKQKLHTFHAYCTLKHCASEKIIYMKRGLLR
jgi:hypothetical protein